VPMVAVGVGIVSYYYRRKNPPAAEDPAAEDPAEDPAADSAAEEA
jgi:hypothetical protein